MSKIEDTSVRSPWRRRFLVVGTLAASGLAVGLWRFYREGDRLTPPPGLEAGEGSTLLTAWIQVGSANLVTVHVPRQEMGQGITTTLPMLVAEELDADPAQMRFVQAPIDPVFANATMVGDGVPFRHDDHGWLARTARTTQSRFGALLGVQGTGGSTSVRDAWLPMRRAGATARAMLVSAAAERFGVPPSECVVEKGAVRHPASGKTATFGALAVSAGRRPIPRDVALKSPAQFRILGTSPPRLDIPSKTDGSAIFGSDVLLPGMRHAVLVQCPVFGGSLKSFDASAAQKMPGVRAVLPLARTATSAAAVAVVADHHWQARKALAAVTVTWDDGPAAGHDTTTQRERYRALLREGDARVYDEAGEVEHALAAPPVLVDAEYFAPYLAHATMEPVNATAIVRRDGTCEVWVGNQAPTLVKWFAAQAAGVDTDRVTVHTPHLGGGFGRRIEMDVVLQAVTLARSLPDTPIQLLWSREDDMQHDVYRPMAAARMQAALDSSGRVIGWAARVVSQSCTGEFSARLLPAAASDAMKDKTTTEGLFDLPYRLPNRRTSHVLTHEPVPVGYWRSVGHGHNAFFAESFVDECAAAAKRDPVEFRRALLADSPRHRQVLDVAAARAGWGSPVPAGTGRGVALAESFHSIVAQVAEVEIVDGAPRVRRVVCAIDCGFALHPDTVVAQMESAIVFGLTAALHGEITTKDGRVQQGNFGDYPLLRLADTPDIEVLIVNSGVEHLGGVGEPGTPPVAPAVCNAIFAATGKRIRSLPIRMA
jgi:isoquinoline 1-oxidoreductase beta subunit